MLVPLYGFAQGDTLGLLVLVNDDDTIATLASTLQEAATVRVAPAANPRVCHAGKRLDPRLTVSAAGLTPLSRVDLVNE